MKCAINIFYRYYRLHILSTALLFCPDGSTFSQTTGIVMAGGTKTPIPYANIWVENSSIGTTSDLEGAFRFSEDLIGKTLIVSAIGYYPKNLTIDSTYIELLMEQRIYQIPEVGVQRYRGQSESVISSYNKSNIKKYIGPLVPLIYARRFNLSEEQKLTPFIKTIQIITASKKDCKINLRVFSTTEAGQPGDDLVNRNLLIEVKKGLRKTTISVVDLEVLKIPAEGVFIGFEYLIVPENEYIYRSRDKENKRTEVLGYMPMLGVIETTSDDAVWCFYGGKWEKNIEIDDSLFDFKYRTIAMEVIVSN